MLYFIVTNLNSHTVFLNGTPAAGGGASWNNPPPANIPGRGPRGGHGTSNTMRFDATTPAGSSLAFDYISTVIPPGGGVPIQVTLSFSVNVNGAGYPTITALSSDTNYFRVAASLTQWGGNYDYAITISPGA
jgi:hypothetical protein